MCSVGHPKFLNQIIAHPFRGTGSQNPRPHVGRPRSQIRGRRWCSQLRFLPNRETSFSPPSDALSAQRDINLGHSDKAAPFPFRKQWTAFAKIEYMWVALPKPHRVIAVPSASETILATRRGRVARHHRFTQSVKQADTLKRRCLCTNVEGKRRADSRLADLPTRGNTAPAEKRAPTPMSPVMSV